MLRLSTKKDRENSRKFQFETLINEGYNKTEYKNLIIFANYSNLMLKSFWGTAANHTDFYRYRTAEQLTAKIEELKRTADSREKYKEEQKQKNKGYKSSHAAAAAAIKSELKAQFPNIKFSVTSDCFSMGNSVDISWTDGATEKEIKKITSKYQYGNFNGMDDMYEITNNRTDIPQAKYVSEHRKLSDDLINKVSEQMSKIYDFPQNSPTHTAELTAKRLLSQTNIPTNYNEISISLINSNSVYLEDLFNITFHVDVTHPTLSDNGEKSSGQETIKIVDYSEKSVVIIGDFSAYYDELIKMGGRYNKFLKCGRGIVFSKSKTEALKAYFLSKRQTPSQEKQKDIAQQKENNIFNIEDSQILLTPTNNKIELEYFKIIWHEGRHIEGATFENCIFNTWEDVQRAFFILWKVNESDSNGGYTKVKVEMKITGEDSQTFRIDITNRHFNGDFNPSLQHITEYIKDEGEETTTEKLENTIQSL